MMLGHGMKGRVVDLLNAIYETAGASQYDGEAVTQNQHALQCARLSDTSASEPWLTCAALLHDIGHMIPHVSQQRSSLGVIDHGSSGADFLLYLGFPEEVTEPVRLHIDAKRYLCAVDNDYLLKLSEASRLSLAMQGGPMSEMEREMFRQRPMAGAAIQIRLWDDSSKDVDLHDLPSFYSYREHLLSVL